MERDPLPAGPESRFGGYALGAGIGATVALCLPVIGDFVALPAAAVAIVLGIIGMRHHEMGRASGSGSAIAGLLLGAVAVTGAVAIFAATRSPL